MAKINKPLLSLSAIGALGKHLVFRRRGKGIVAQQTARPVDRRSFAQLQWRTMYQKAIALWHLLSPSEKAAWERQATPRHMTGFAYFISQALKPNPGIYLPLSGGTMTGNIDLATSKILNLPAPTSDEEPTRKVDLATHAALEAAIHGLKGEVSFSAYQTSNQLLANSTYTTLDWQAEEWDVGGYFDLTNNRYKPLIPGKYHFDVCAYLRYIEETKRAFLLLYKNATLHKYFDLKEAVSYDHLILNGSVNVSLNGSSDYVRFVVWQNALGTNYTYGTSHRTWVQGYLLPQT